jgi:fumarate hydratase subunit alpha
MDNSILTNKISKLVERAIKRAVTRAPDDLIELLKKKLKNEEESELAIEQMSLIIENFNYADKKKIPICQDTGVLNFYIKLGSKFPIISDYRELIKKSVINATENIPLRGNTVDPITGFNPENNIGINSPPIYLEIANNSYELEMKILAKGGGAENMSKLFMLNPSNGLNQMKRKIENLVKNAGGMPCPPIILGIGIGGDATSCMKLAKQSLLRPLSVRHPRKDIADLERELIKRLNELNVGVMGLGGKTTCLDVHIDIAMRHPASFPVGVIVQCYSHRWASFKINERGDIIEEI